MVLHAMVPAWASPAARVGVLLLPAVPAVLLQQLLLPVRFRRRGLLRILRWRARRWAAPLLASARARERREQLQQYAQLQQWLHAQQMLRVRAQIRVPELRELWSWNNRNHPTKLASSFRAHSFVPAALAWYLVHDCLTCARRPEGQPVLPRSGLRCPGLAVPRAMHNSPAAARP